MTSDAAKATALLQPIVGMYLSQLGVGVGQLQMHFSGEASLSYENDIRVDGSASVKPQSLDGLALLLPLLNETVTQVAADGSGGLSLSFGTSRIQCDGDQHYEAWTYNGPNRVMVVSIPGGDLAIWS